MKLMVIKTPYKKHSEKLSKLFYEKREIEYKDNKTK